MAIRTRNTGKRTVGNTFPRWDVTLETGEVFTLTPANSVIAQISNPESIYNMLCRSELNINSAGNFTVLFQYKSGAKKVTGFLNNFENHSVEEMQSLLKGCIVSVPMSATEIEAEWNEDPSSTPIPDPDEMPWKD